MSKFFLFYILFYLTGNPLLALLILLAAVYLIDRNTMRVLPDWSGRLSTWGRIRGLKRTVSLNPEHAGALTDLGSLLVRRGDYTQAVPFLERALPKMADSDEANFYLGFAYLRTGQREKARERLEKVLGLNPRFGYGEPHLRLGGVLSGPGGFEDRRAAIAAIRGNPQIEFGGVLQAGKGSGEIRRKEGSRPGVSQRR